MKTLCVLIKRNIKYYFKDKAMFFGSLITPLILLFLFVTFLGNIYKDSLSSALANDVDKIVNLNSFLDTFSFEFLLSSVFATCTVTIPFTTNMIMVSDKSKGMINDINVTPVSRTKLSLAYYISTVISSSIICYFALTIGLVVLSFIGFNLSFIDVLLIIFDIFIMILFATSLSSIICCFLKTEGSISAVSTIVSSIYGFLAGAYMPISNLEPSIQKFISFLPGTYGTILFKKHFLHGSVLELERSGLNNELLYNLKKSFDYSFYFFDHEISALISYLVLIIITLLLIGIYIAINIRRNKKAI